MKNKLFIGDLELSSPVLYAPLAGCSDYPYRKMSAKYKPALMFCEMVKMEALIRKVPATMKMLEISSEMHPIGGQICGSNPKIAGEAAKIIEDLGFDLVDLNCGCPVDKITKDGSGSGTLKNPELIGEIIDNMRAAVKIPVTVKIRAGWDDEHIVAPEVTKIAEKAGAQAITVHGRTREQAYKGLANRDYIKACKEAASTIKVVGNGDIFTAEDALAMLTYTGCDAVLVARGTMGQPWIAEDIKRLLEGLPPLPRTFSLRKDSLLEHFGINCEYKNERGTLIDMRKIGCWYFKKGMGVKDFREKISHAQSLEEVKTLIDSFQGFID